MIFAQYWRHRVRCLYYILYIYYVLVWGVSKFWRTNSHFIRVEKFYFVLHKMLWEGLQSVTFIAEAFSYMYIHLWQPLMKLKLLSRPYTRQLLSPATLLFVHAAHEISNAIFYKLLENRQPALSIPCTLTVHCFVFYVCVFMDDCCRYWSVQYLCRWLL